MLRAAVLLMVLFGVAHAEPAVPDATLRAVGHREVLLVDADYRYLHGFASVNLLMPIATASGATGSRRTARSSGRMGGC